MTGPMLRLLLMRHAKSSWSDPDLDDHERPLNRRGRASADVMASWLAETGNRPDLVISSDAARALETWDRMKRVLGSQETRLVVADALYSAGPDSMLRALQTTPKGVRKLLMVGHQPVVSSFARKLTRGTASSSCARAFRKFPTAAIAVFELEAKTWAKARYGDADFRSFACPRELVDA